MPTPVNETILIAGYGSLLSGHGMLTVRRNGKSRLMAQSAAMIVLPVAGVVGGLVILVALKTVKADMKRVKK